MGEDSNQKLGDFFTWRDALWLPRWKRLASIEELDPKIIRNLTEVFLKLNQLRKFLNNPIVVVSAFRPPEYNKLIGGAVNSAHMEGKAVDFKVKFMRPDEVRQIILRYGMLEVLNIRMEDLPGSSWIHIDTRDPGYCGKRFFLPKS